MNLKPIFRNTLLFLAGLVLFWLGPLKIISRLEDRFGHSAPCPASLAWLVNNPLRQRTMQPVLDWIGICPGETVLELGPGPGAFTIDAARRAGADGRIIAVDIQPQMIAQVDRRVQKAGLANVETHVAGAYALPIEDDQVDRAFLVSVLPEIPDRPRALGELGRVLKPGGRLSITAEFADPHYQFRGETIRLVESNGFTLLESHGNIWRYTLNFSLN